MASNSSNSARLSSGCLCMYENWAIRKRTASACTSAQKTKRTRCHYSTRQTSKSLMRESPALTLKATPGWPDAIAFITSCIFNSNSIVWSCFASMLDSRLITSRFITDSTRRAPFKSSENNNGPYVLYACILMAFDRSGHCGKLIMQKCDCLHTYLTEFYLSLYRSPSQYSSLCRLCFQVRLRWG